MAKKILPGVTIIAKDYGLDEIIKNAGGDADEIAKSYPINQSELEIKKKKSSSSHNIHKSKPET